MLASGGEPFLLEKFNFAHPAFERVRVRGKGRINRSMIADRVKTMAKEGTLTVTGVGRGREYTLVAGHKLLEAKWFEELKKPKVEGKGKGKKKASTKKSKAKGKATPPPSSESYSPPGDRPPEPKVEDPFTVLLRGIISREAELRELIEKASEHVRIGLLNAAANMFTKDPLLAEILSSSDGNMLESRLIADAAADLAMIYGKTVLRGDDASRE